MHAGPEGTDGRPAADPAREIRITARHAARGHNYWARCPVIRVDLVVGAFDAISSADVPGVTEALMDAMPGLIEHECSIGARGGFRTRLRRGTYPPHILEHVALELQVMAGHEVGYGRTRGGDLDGEYTLVFEYRHERVGLAAAELALDAVQRAFAGTLDTVAPAVRALQALAERPDVPSLAERVRCGITGGGERALIRAEVLRRCAARGDEDAPIVDVAPGDLLRTGLPYARSDVAIVRDARPSDVPLRYREPTRARRLVSVLVDGVRPGGFVVCPAGEWEIQDYARERGRRVAIFAAERGIARPDARVAAIAAHAEGGRIVIETGDSVVDAGAVDAAFPTAAQVAAAVADFALSQDERSREDRSLDDLSHDAGDPDSGGRDA